MTTSTIIYGSDGSAEITEYDDQGTPIRRTYGSIERPAKEYGDVARFGWDFDHDHVTIGELAETGKSD